MNLSSSQILFRRRNIWPQNNFMPLLPPCQQNSTFFPEKPMSHQKISTVLGMTATLRGKMGFCELQGGDLAPLVLTLPFPSSLRLQLPEGFLRADLTNKAPDYLTLKFPSPFKEVGKPLNTAFHAMQHSDPTIRVFNLQKYWKFSGPCNFSISSSGFGTSPVALRQR